MLHRLVVGFLAGGEQRQQIRPVPAENLLRGLLAFDLVGHIHDRFTGSPELFVQAHPGRVDPQHVVQVAVFLGQFLPGHNDRFRVSVNFIRYNVHLLDGFSIDSPLRRPCQHVVRPFGGIHRAPGNLFREIDRQPRAFFQRFSDVLQAACQVFKRNTLADVLQLGVHALGFALGVLFFVFQVLDFGLSLDHLGLRVGQGGFHVPVLLAGRLNSLGCQIVQRFLGVDNDRPLSLQLTLQQRGLVRHVQLFVAVQLQLRLVGFQLRVKRFDLRRRLFDALLE